MRDNDSFLAGDSFRNERGNDYQAGTIETENGTIDAGNVYAESFYVLHGSDGRVYFLAEIEGTGLSNDLSQDDYFTFIGHVPPAGVELTAVAQRNVFGGIRYSSLNAGDIADPNTDTPSVAIDDTVSASEDSDGIGILANLLSNDDLGSASSIEVSAINGDATNVGSFINLVGGGRVFVGSDGSVQFDANGDFEALGVGETEVVTFNYTVTDNAGNTSTATILITVTGTNDDPVVASGILVGVQEDDAAVSVDLLDGASDVDNGTTLSITNVTGLVAGLTIVGNTLTVDPSDAAFQSLAQGETLELTVSYDVVDGDGGSATQTATITITGTNDAPTVAAALTTAATEDASTVTLDLLDGASDVDNGATLSITNVTGLVAGLTIVGTTLTVDPSDITFQSLAEGETLELTVSYDVVDGNGGSAAQTATITITGTNDAPTVAAALTAAATEDDPAFTLDLLNGASDVDASDTLNIAGLTLVSGDDSGVTINGNTIDVDPSAFNALASGQSETIEYSYTIEDGNNGAVAQTATITITGTNDAPTVAAALTATATEDEATFTLDLLNGASDVDNGATLSIANVTGLGDGLELEGSVLTVDPSDLTFQSLSAGERRDITISYDVIDGNGGSVAQTATITIIGTNDAPFVPNGLDPDLGTVIEGSTTAFNNLFVFDVDGPDQVSITDIRTSNGSFVQTNNIFNFEFIAPEVGPEGEPITITVDYTDGIETTTVERTVFVANNNSTPIINGVVTLSPSNEDTTRIITSTELLQAVTDADGDTLSLENLSIASGNGSINDNGDSTFNYTPAENDDTEVTFAFDVSDGIATTSGTATLDILPVNDAPTLGSQSFTLTEDTQRMTINVATLGDDVDLNDTLTYAITGQLPEGFVLITGTELFFDQNFEFEDLNDGETREAVVQVTATDSNGASATNNITFTITGINDDPEFQFDSVSLGEAPGVSRTFGIDQIVDVDTIVEDAMFISATSDLEGVEVQIADDGLSFELEVIDDRFLPLGIGDQSPQGTVSLELSTSEGTFSDSFDISISPSNEPPTANDDGQPIVGAAGEILVSTGAATIIDVLANDTDPNSINDLFIVEVNQADDSLIIEILRGAGDSGQDVLSVQANPGFGNGLIDPTLDSFSYTIVDRNPDFPLADDPRFAARDTADVFVTLIPEDLVS